MGGARGGGAGGSTGGVQVEAGAASAAATAPKAALVSIAVGAEHGCVVRGSGALVCWGAKAKLGQQVGDTEAPYQLEPKPLPALAKVKVTEVVTQFDESCVRTEGKEAWCWGDGRAPAKVAGVAGIRQLDVGMLHAATWLAGARTWMASSATEPRSTVTRRSP